jgi:RimJ/RimL family protein N-acetyltransferase
MKNSGLTLRPYRLRDLPALRSLFAPEILFQASSIEAGAFSSLFSLHRWLRTTFEVLYIIEAGENGRRRIVGFLGLYNIKIGQSLCLSLAIFNPKDRRRGYGRQSFGLLLDSLRNNNVARTVYVKVLKTNVPSLSFCKNLGFEVCGQYQDRFLMEKNQRKEYNVPYVAENSG